MRYTILMTAERFFSWLTRWAEDMRERCAFCSKCGRNRYTGAPCVGEE